MAGHPTVGTTFALAHDGVIAPGRERWMFGLNVGPTPVASTGRTARWTWRGWIRAGRHFARRRCPAEDVVRRHRRRSRRVEGDRAGRVEEGTCGAAYFYVPLATRAAVDACEPDGAAMRRAAQRVRRRATIGVFVFSAEAVEATAPRFTAGCSRRRPAWSRIRPPAAPAVRSAPTSCGTASCRRQAAAHRQRAGRQDGPPEPSARPRRGDRRPTTSPACTSAGGAVRVGEGTITLVGRLRTSARDICGR